MNIMRLILSFYLALLLAYSSVSIAAVTKAPNITLPSLKGEFELSQLKGRVVYLDFWASWCEPCKKSFPWMNDMKAMYKKQGLEIVAVNLDKDRKLADAFLREMNVNFIVAFDQSGDVASKYKVMGMPSSYLIGRDGGLYASHIGFRQKDKAKMEAAIQKLLKQ
jgi:thiol-disulfide isomerase/thioredoxin